MIKQTKQNQAKRKTERKKNKLRLMKMGNENLQNFQSTIIQEH